MKPKLFIIAGPTASGKSDLAIEIAKRLDGELVCADSLTVYRGINIGSAKPSTTQRSQVRHHLLDIRNPEEPFTAADFLSEATTAIKEITDRGKRPIVVGGTGLYLKVLLGGLSEAPGENPCLRKMLNMRAAREGSSVLLEELRLVDPDSAERCHTNNLFRIVRALEVWHTTGRPISSFHKGHEFAERNYDDLSICLDIPRALLYERIEKRVDSMLEAGLVDEVKELLASGIPEGSKPLQAIGYKEVTAYLKGETDIQTVATLIKQNTRNLAKRQITWFKKESAMSLVAYPENSANILSMAEKFFKEGERPNVQDPIQHSGPVPEPGTQGKSQDCRQNDVRRSH